VSGCSGMGVKKLKAGTSGNRIGGDLKTCNLQFTAGGSRNLKDISDRASEGDEKVK